MAGVKGRSGRKKNVERVNPAELSSLAIRMLYKRLVSADRGEFPLSDSDLFKAIVPIASKQIAEQVQLTISHELNAEQIAMLESRICNLLTPKQIVIDAITSDLDNGTEAAEASTTHPTPE